MSKFRHGKISKFLTVSVLSLSVCVVSAAAVYAKANGYIKFGYPQTEPEKYDFNENGYADSNDAVAIRDYLSDYDYSGGVSADFDANGDGITTAADFVLVRQYGFDIYTELWRPQYHYTPRYGAINDPNGLVYFKGKWHMFYQLCPNNPPRYGNAHWGHAVSDDLVHWEEQQIALYCDSDGYPWSGTAYWDKENRSGFFDGVEDGGMIIAYSTNNEDGVGIAYSADGITFTKIGMCIDNVYYAHKKEYFSFRDPKIFYSEEDEVWYCIIGTAEQKVYSSNDLRHWASVWVNADIISECPDIFKMTVEETGEETWVYSCAGRDFCICDFENGELITKTGKISMSEGMDNYAGITFANEPDGRILMLGWLNNWKYAQDAYDGQWSSALTMIYELTLHYSDGSYYMTQKPASEYESLYCDILASAENAVLTDGETILTEPESQTFKTHLEIDIDNTDGFEYKFCMSDDGEEETVVKFDSETFTVSINRSESIYGNEALTEEYPEFSFIVEEKYVKNGILDLDIYCDVSCTEIFAAGGRYALRTRIQPFATSLGMALTANGRLALKNASVTAIDSIWNDSEKAAGVQIYETAVTLTAGDEAGYFLRAASYMNIQALTAEPSDGNLFRAEVTDGGIMLYGLKAGSGTLTVRSGRFGRTVTITVE